jgi:hypothetical protein
MTIEKPGSYQLCCNEDGTFTFDLIEDMEMAEEAAEDMHFVIQQQKQVIQNMRTVLNMVRRRTHDVLANARGIVDEA